MKYFILYKKLYLLKVTMYISYPIYFDLPPSLAFSALQLALTVSQSMLGC